MSKNGLEAAEEREARAKAMMDDATAPVFTFLSAVYSAGETLAGSYTDMLASENAKRDKEREAEREAARRKAEREAARSVPLNEDNSYFEAPPERTVAAPYDEQAFFIAGKARARTPEEVEENFRTYQKLMFEDEDKTWFPGAGEDPNEVGGAKNSIPDSLLEEASGGSKKKKS